MKSIVMLLVLLMVLVVSCTPVLPGQAPAPPSTSQPIPTQPSTSAATPTPSATLTSPAKLPTITIALDYFGVRNTHWIDQVGGSTKAQVQLIAMLSDSTDTLMTWPPDPESQTFSMDFFQVIPLKDFMGGTSVLYTGSVNGTLSLRVIANNVNKGVITKAQIDMIKLLGGGDLTSLKSLIPDKEFIDAYWQTWSPTNNWGVGTQYTNDVPQGSKDLIVWGRIGTTNQIPTELPKPPALKPNIALQDLSLPMEVRVRQPGEQYSYNTWDFSFTIANNEPFGFPIYWRLDSTYSPQTTVGVFKYPTNGLQYVRGNSSYKVTTKYWFTVPGDYQWNYILEYPKGNLVASRPGVLSVKP